MFDFIIKNLTAFFVSSLTIVIIGLLVVNLLQNRVYELNYDQFNFESISYPTIDVVDGDTIRIYNNTARIVGIDTREIWSAKCNEERMKGYAASSKLLALIKSGPVRLEWEKGKDKYGRLLVRIYVNGKDISATAIERGWARPYDGRSRRKGWC